MCTMKRRIVVVTAVCTLTSLCTHPVVAEGERADAEKGGPEQHAAKYEAYLGVGVESLGPALASQLSDLLGDGKDQGLLVNEIAPGSAAEKAGIRKYDVLTKFDDQRLYSEEQLQKLIHADKPGRTVTLGVIRTGKRLQVQAALGEQEELPHVHFRAHGYHPFRHGMMPAFRGDHRFGSGRVMADWESFDSLSMEKEGKDRYKVSIEYLDKNGKEQRHEFEGTREEIHRAIQAEKDLPDGERAHLFRSLGMHGPMMMFHPRSSFRAHRPPFHAGREPGHRFWQVP